MLILRFITALVFFATVIAVLEIAVVDAFEESSSNSDSVCDYDGLDASNLTCSDSANNKHTVSPTNYSLTDQNSTEIEAKKQPEVLVVTVADDPNHFALESLKRSVQYLGYSSDIITLEINHGKGGNNNRVLLKKFLDEDLPKDQLDRLVLFTEGHDTLFQLKAEQLVNRFQKFESKGIDVVFAAELECLSDESVCEQYSSLVSQSNSDEESKDRSPFRFLNGGSFIGKAKKLRKLLENRSNEQEYVPHSDQRYFSVKYTQSLERSFHRKSKHEEYAETDEVRIGLDNDCLLFQQLNNFRDWTVQYQPNRLVNEVTKSQPVVLRGNGQSARTLIGISNYIPVQRAGIGSAVQSHVRLEVYPLAIGVFFTSSAVEEHFMARILELKLDLTQVDLYVYYGVHPRHTISDEALQSFKTFTVLQDTTKSPPSTYSDCEARSAFVSMARKTAVKHAFMVDSDHIIQAPNVVSDLASWNQAVVAGHSQRENQLWTNYWTDMSDDGWYINGFDTRDLYKREKLGLWQVPFASGLLLVRADALEVMEHLFSAHTTLSGLDCIRHVNIDAMHRGLAFFIDNRNHYATMIEDTSGTDEGETGETFARESIQYSNALACGDAESDCIEPTLTPGTLRIPRESNLSLRDYYEKYEDTQTPVIIEDYAQVFAGINERNIRDMCGTATASMATRANEKEDVWASVSWQKHGTLIDAMSTIKDESNRRRDSSANGHQPSREGSMIGVFDWSLAHNCPRLLEEHFLVPKYIAQDLLQRVPAKTDLAYRDYWPSLFVGVNGTYGGSHTDVFGSAFWMYVVEGAKEWHVVDPVDRDVNFFSPKNDHAVRHYHDIVRKGSLLIIPSNRWHQVRNLLGSTITLAGNFIGRGSFESMKQEVMKKSNSKSFYYVQLEQALLRPGFGTSVDYEQGDMPWREFKEGQTRNMKE